MERRKYGNHIIQHPLWGKFDSDLEMARYIFLRNREEKGEISSLRRQVTFELLPKQFVEEVVHLKTKDKVEKRFAEHPVYYKADFVYERGGKTIVEDCKGEDKVYFKGGHRKRFSTQTADFAIKRKLMLYFHKIRIQIVSNPTFWEKD